MAIEFCDLEEVAGYQTYDEVPRGSLVQFVHDDRVYCTIKTSHPQNGRIINALIIGGPDHSILLDRSDMPLCSYINIEEFSKIIILIPGKVPKQILSGPTMGCLYKDVTNGVFYVWGTILMEDRKEHYWVCVESAFSGITRGDSFQALNMSNMLPISTEMEVRRRDWRA